MKTFVQNRHDKKLAVVIKESIPPKGLAFVMHGLGGWKEQPHIQTFAQAFIDNGLTTVLFDAAHTYGESEGDYADATTTNYYEDLEDVINWSKNQKWYAEPFWLAGHSLGGIATTLYAAKYPDKVKALAPISTVVSGELSRIKYSPEELENWERTGWREKPSLSRVGLMKRIKWGEMEDRMRYDLLTEAHTLNMPVLMIVGDNDDVTPQEHQNLLFEKLPGKKEFHVIKDAPHTFREQGHLDEIKIIFDSWIKSNLQES